MAVPKGEGLTSGGVVVGQPSLYYDGGVLVIKGTVHAEAASNNDIPGRLDADLVGPTGELIDEMPMGFVNARAVPSDPARMAMYEMRWDIHPTPEETIRVRFVDPATALQENAADKTKLPRHDTGMAAK